MSDSGSDINFEATSYNNAFPYKDWAHTQQVSNLSRHRIEQDKLARNIERRLLLPLEQAVAGNAEQGSWERAFEVLRSKHTRKGVRPEHYVLLIDLLLKTTTSHVYLLDQIRGECFGGDLAPSAPLYRALVSAYMKRRKLIDAAETLEEGCKRLTAQERGSGNSAKRSRGGGVNMSDGPSISPNEGLIGQLGSPQETYQVCMSVLELAASSTVAECDADSLQSLGQTRPGSVTPLSAFDQVLAYLPGAGAAQLRRSLATGAGGSGKTSAQGDLARLRQLRARAAAQSGSWRHALELTVASSGRSGPSSSAGGQAAGLSASLFASPAQPQDLHTTDVTPGAAPHHSSEESTSSTTNLSKDPSALVKLGLSAASEAKRWDVALQCYKAVLDQPSGQAYLARQPRLHYQLRYQLYNCLGELQQWKQALALFQSQPTIKGNEGSSSSSVPVEDASDGATMDLLLTGLYNGGASDASIVATFDQMRKRCGTSELDEIFPAASSPTSVASLFPGAKKGLGDAKLSSGGKDRMPVGSSSRSPTPEEDTTTLAPGRWMEVLKPCGASIIATSLLGLGRWQQSLAVTRACSQLQRGPLARWLHANQRRGLQLSDISPDQLPQPNRVDARFLQVCSTVMLQQQTAGNGSVVDSLANYLGPLQVFMAAASQGTQQQQQQQSTSMQQGELRSGLSRFFAQQRVAQYQGPGSEEMPVRQHRFAPSSLRPTRSDYTGVSESKRLERLDDRRYMQAVVYSRAQRRFTGSDPYEAPLKAPGSLNDMSSGWGHFGSAPKHMKWDARGTPNALSDLQKKFPVMKHGIGMSWGQSTPRHAEFSKTSNAKYVDPGSLPDNNLL